MLYTINFPQIVVVFFFRQWYKDVVERKNSQLYHPRYAFKWGFKCLALWRKILIIKYIKLRIPSPQKDLLKMRDTNRRISKEKWSLGIYSHLNIGDGVATFVFIIWGRAFLEERNNLPFSDSFLSTPWLQKKTIFQRWFL